MAVHGALSQHRFSAACFPQGERQTVVPQSPQVLLLTGWWHENQSTFFTTRSTPQYNHFHPRWRALAHELLVANSEAPNFRLTHAPAAGPEVWSNSCGTLGLVGGEIDSPTVSLRFWHARPIPETTVNETLRNCAERRLSQLLPYSLRISYTSGISFK
jgi:hypothetical protein